MKNAIKAMLPQSVLNAARAIRDGHDLRRIQTRGFNAAHLKPANDIDLGAIWNDPAIIKNWAADHKKIQDTFQEDDKWGGINPGDRKAIYFLIQGLQAKSVLEVGTHIGASTLYIAQSLKQNGAAKSALTTVDILDVNDPQNGSWVSLGMARSPKDNLKKMGCAALCGFITNTAQGFMKEAVAQESATFDFIFLDGDHTASGVYNEVSLALDLLKPGGIILLHDYYPGGKALFADGNIIYGPLKALERIGNDTPSVTVKPLGALAWPTKQGSNHTSLAIVMKNE